MYIKIYTSHILEKILEKYKLTSMQQKPDYISRPYWWNI